MQKGTANDLAEVLAQRLDELGRVTEEDGRLTRTFLSPAMARANALVGSWMREAGLAVHEDEAGNLVGRLEAPTCRAGSPDSTGPGGATAVEDGGVGRPRPTSKPIKTLLLGSHLDTVRNAGRFDGALGVVLPIVALAELRARGVELPFAVEVLGFSEEEAVRFAGAYIGSKAFTGKLKESDLRLRDARGKTLREAIEVRAGKRCARPKAAHRRSNLIGYFEVHIEQGPVLEAAGMAVGTVAAIASQTRGRLTFQGKAGHAGTTPMKLRRDALTGAAEFILFAEKFAAERGPLVATVGTVAIPSGAANVIPGEVTVSLDVRHARDAACRAAVAKLVAKAKRIARRRQLDCAWQLTMQEAATPCSTKLTTMLTESVRAVQGKSLSLVSGAGHDGVVMARTTPIAMLFVRCREGLSHHPDEFAAPRDLAVALRVVVDFIERLAKQNLR